jgi:hypothetical protein
MSSDRRAAAAYLRFLLWAFGATLLVALAGALPTRRLAGESGLGALAVGCAVTLAAAAVGAVPLVRAVGKSEPQALVLAVMVAVGLRLGFVLAAALVLLAGDWFPERPLLIWIAISYLAVLIVETRFAVSGIARVSRRPTEGES